MKSIYLLLTGFLIFLTAGCSTTNLPVASKQNRSYEYQPATALTHEVRTENDSLHIYLRFADKGFFAFPQNLAVEYMVSLSYEKPEITLKDSVRLVNKKVFVTTNAAIIDFKIPLRNIRHPAVMLVNVYSRRNPANVIRHDIRLTAAEVQKTYLLIDANTNLPLFRNYVLPGQAFFIAQFGVAVPGELKKFTSNFSPALPPMANTENKPAANLKKIKTISFLSDTVKLEEVGLYSIEINGKAVGGLLVEENAFPELTSAKELIDPLIYLTTTKERENLLNAKDPKAAVDQFWLNIVPDQKQARELIKTYYQRVADANRFFSSHKAGWLTDRGMIYLVFGPPKVLNRYLDREEWGYPEDAYRSAVKFVFLKKPNTFTQNHYELVRSPALEGFWYRTVEQWRTGTVEK